MKHPPYSLRPNKAIDRMMLIEALRHVGMPGELADYTYYGFGGPYLEDFRLLHEAFPQMRMVSVESDPETYKQQRFHLPCKHIRLRRTDFRSFLAKYEARDRKAIFWLDYTKLRVHLIEEFAAVLEAATEGSVVKITLRCEPEDYLEEKQQQKFKTEFASFLSSHDTAVPTEFENLAALAQRMLRIAAQNALSSATDYYFQPITSFCYSDSAGIYTLTGMVSKRIQREQIQNKFKTLAFKNLNWGNPVRIDVPFLSTKERLQLQQHLPCDRDAGRRLARVLGYKLERSRTHNSSKMKQYSQFYRQYPHFIRAIP